MNDIFLLYYQIDQATITGGEFFLFALLFGLVVIATVEAVDFLKKKQTVDLRKQQYVDYDFLKNSLAASLAVIFVCFNLIMLFLSPSFYVKNDSYNKELYHKGDYVKKDILSFCESAYTNIEEIVNIDRLKTCLKDNEGLFNYYLKMLNEGKSVPSFNRDFNKLFYFYLSKKNYTATVEYPNDEARLDEFFSIDNKENLILKEYTKDDPRNLAYEIDNRYFKKDREHSASEKVWFPFAINKDFSNYQLAIFKLSE